MAMNRKTALGVFSIVGILLGVVIGWAIWGRSSNNVAGNDCTLADGVTKGKTDSTGVCKA